MRSPIKTVHLSVDDRTRIGTRTSFHNNAEPYRILFLLTSIMISIRSVAGFEGCVIGRGRRHWTTTAKTAKTRIRHYYHVKTTLQSASPRDAPSSYSPKVPVRNDTPTPTTNSLQERYTTKTTTNYPSFVDQLCDLQLPEGRCVGLTLQQDFLSGDTNALTVEAITKINSNNHNHNSHWIYQWLDPEEIEFGLSLLSTLRRETFFMGRMALREAMVGVLPQNDQQVIPPILKDNHGRPTMPPGYLGSISHKDKTGVGLIAKNVASYSTSSPPTRGIGIDLERTASNRRSVAKKILTPKEIEALGRIAGITAEEEVLLRFRYVEKKERKRVWNWNSYCLILH